MKKPNVILMFVDDLGYGDINAFNPESKIKTPNIDALANAGMKFTDSHAASAICTPSRYALMTGRYAFRSNLKYSVITGDSLPLLEEQRMTMADLFKQNGYNTACVGKWHLGLQLQLNKNFKQNASLGEQKLYDDVPLRNNKDITIAPLTSTWVEALDIDFTKPILNGPNQHGFDYFFGMAASLDQAPYTYIENDAVLKQPTALSGEIHVDRVGAKMQQKWQCGPIAPGFDHEQVLDDMNDKVLNLIDDYSKADEPFFIYYPTPAVHGPLLPNKKFKGKSGINAYADVVMQVDDMVGQITSKLKETGIAEDTIFIFTSDNGCSGVADIPLLQSHGHYPSYTFRGNKISLFEGGHRVPTIVSYPKMIAQNSVCDDIICHADFFATFADMFGTKLNDNTAEDSFSNLKLWDKTGKCARTATVYSCLSGHLGIVKNGYKLNLCQDGGHCLPLLEATYNGEVYPTTFELYDLNSDPCETTNIIENHPEIVEDLKTELTKIFDNGRTTPGAKQQNNPAVNWFQINWKNCQ